MPIRFTKKGFFIYWDAAGPLFRHRCRAALRDEMRLALFRNRFSAIEHSDISAAPRHHRRARARHQRRALPWLTVFP